MSILLGFVLGATLPTYALLTSNKIKLGDVGEWMGAIATFLAVWVSLYLANRNSKAKLDIRPSSRDAFRIEEQPAFDIVNLGLVSASVRVEIKITMEFVKKMLDSYEDQKEKINFYNGLNNELDLMVSDINSKTINPYNRLEVGRHNSVVVKVDTSRIVKWLSHNTSISGQYDIVMVVEDVDGKKVKIIVANASLSRISEDGAF